MNSSVLLLVAKALDNCDCATLVIDYVLSSGFLMRGDFFYATTDTWCFLDILDSYFVDRDDGISMLLSRTELAVASFSSAHFGMSLVKFCDRESPFSLQALFSEPISSLCMVCSHRADVKIMQGSYSVCLCRECYLNPNAWFWLGSARESVVPAFEKCVRQLWKYDALFDSIQMIGCRAAAHADELCTCGQDTNETGHQ